MMDTVFEDESLVLRPTAVDVDLAALRFNVGQVKRAVGAAQIMATVKANAYGHGLLRTSRELLRFGVDQLGVAFLEEGIALRKAGITAPILVLGGIIGNQISHFLEYDLQLTASSVYKLQQIEETAASMGMRAQVHIKIDTGMGRIGVRPESAYALFAAVVDAQHCELSGVFSHFASSHARDGAFTLLQLDRFLDALEFFPRHGIAMPTRHIANSGAILQHPDSVLDMVRPGIMLYGVYPGPEVERSIVVTPTLSFKTRVVYFKTVPRGFPIGYDHTWTPSADTRIVTLPVGYGDGYPRSLSNSGHVLIHGRRHPIVGMISMDQCMIDIGATSAFNGDEVVLIGSQGDEHIRIEEIAGRAGTIPYEILTNINTRVPRRYRPSSDEGAVSTDG
jgi:alanine racemase